MNVLGIETATAVCAAALAKDERCIAERTVEAPQAHSEQLVALIESVLNDVSMRPVDLDGIAVSIGPGSFTGLRIGLSAAKGLAYALGKPLLSVPTLEALAWNGMIQNEPPDGSIILAAIESRREEVFAALYRIRNGGLIEEQPPAAIGMAAAAGFTHRSGPVMIVGSGAEHLQKYLEQEQSQHGTIVIPPRERRQCSAAAIAVLGCRRLGRNELADLASIEPLYLKEFFTTARPVHTTV